LRSSSPSKNNTILTITKKLAEEKRSPIKYRELTTEI